MHHKVERGYCATRNVDLKSIYTFASVYHSVITWQLRFYTRMRQIKGISLSFLTWHSWGKLRNYVKMGKPAVIAAHAQALAQRNWLINEFMRTQAHRRRIKRRHRARFPRIRALYLPLPSFAIEIMSQAAWRSGRRRASLLSVRLHSLRCNLRYYCATLGQRECALSLSFRASVVELEQLISDRSLCRIMIALVLISLSCNF